MSEVILMERNRELYSYSRTLLNMYEKLIEGILESGDENLINTIFDANKQLKTLSKSSSEYDFWAGFKYKDLGER